MQAEHALPGGKPVVTWTSKAILGLALTVVAFSAPSDARAGSDGDLRDSGITVSVDGTVRGDALAATESLAPTSKSSGEPANDSPPPRPRDGSPTPRIAGEQPNGVAERVFFHYDEPSVALRSYAVADIGGCTGTMIGPNVLMTAAHCGTYDRNAKFYLYPDADTKLSESFSCAYLTYTFPDMDLLLYWVYPNAFGENAGEKYGYVDFDIDFVPSQPWQFDYAASRARIAVQGSLYSVWTNPIDNLGGGWHAIYSEGTIDETNTAGHWASPNLNNASDYLCSNNWCVGGTRDGDSCGHCPVDPGCPGGTCERRPAQALGVTTDLWSNGGASGSAQLSPDTHRILSGPLSIGQTDGPLRRSPAIADYLQWAYTLRDLTQPGGCRACDVNQINEALLPQLGVGNPADYYGWTDLNLDGMFDIQELVELVRGENTRDWYWLGFESHRRNELWQPLLTIGDVAFDTSYPLRGLAIVDTGDYVSTVYLPTLRHSRLNLVPGQDYRFAFRILPASSTGPNPVRLCWDAAQGACTTFDPPVGVATTYVLPFTATSSTAPQFEFNPDVVALLFDVSIIREGAEAGFDSLDTRETWRDQNSAGRALIWPNGPLSEGPGAVADWAGVVRRDGGAPLVDDWSLINEQFALNGGDAYSVCFDHRTLPSDPLILADGRFVVTEEGTGAIVAGSDLGFTPSTAWTRSCTGPFLAPSDGGTLKFGVNAFSGSAAGGYLVDNIAVTRQEPPGDECAEAIELANGTVAGTTFGARPGGSSSCGNSNASPAVWYHYVAPDDGALQLDTCGSGYDTVLSVHASTCPGQSWNEVPQGCNDDRSSNPSCIAGPGCGGLESCVTLPVDAGSEYLVRVSGYNGAYGSYQLTARFVPFNDDCAAARTIGEGSFGFANYGTTTDGPDESAACAAAGLQQIERDVWYRYTSSCDGVATAALCGSAFDTTLAVYAGGACPASASAVACNDDDCALQSRASFDVLAGAEYLIRVGGFNGATGEGVLTVDCFDDCNGNGTDDLAELAGGTSIRYVPVDFSALHNSNLQAGTNPAFPTGALELGGVPFVIPAGGNNYWHSVVEPGQNPRTIDVPVDRFGVREIHTLINSYWGQPGPASHAWIECFGSDGAYYRKDLLGNDDIRDFRNFVFTNAINGSTTVNVVDIPPDRLDKQTLVLPSDFHDEMLLQVRLTDNGGTDFQRVFLAGLTVLGEMPSLDCNGNGRPDDCDVRGDFNGDDQVNLPDLPSWVACLTSPCTAPPCNPAMYSDSCCGWIDFTGDGDVDLEDFAELQRRFGTSGLMR